MEEVCGEFEVECGRGQCGECAWGGGPGDGGGGGRGEVFDGAEAVDAGDSLTLLILPLPPTSSAHSAAGHRVSSPRGRRRSARFKIF